MQPNTPAQQGGYYPPPPPSNSRPHYAPASTYHHHPSGPPQMMRSPYPVSGGGYHTYPNADSTMHSGFGGSENYGPSDMNGGGGGNLRAHPGAYRGRGYMGGPGSYPPPPPRHYGPPRAGRPEDAFQHSHGNDPVLHTGSPAYRNGNHTPLPSPLINQLAPPRPLPPVTFIQTQDELLEACTALTKCRVVSIEPHLSKSVSGEVSLLAICPDDDSCVYVIDVPKIQRVYVYKYLHPVLSDSEITTLVYNIDHVGPALIQRLGFSFARLVDLQSLALAVEWVMYGVNRLHNLDTAVENVLQMTAKPSHIAKIEKEVLTDGNSDVWDERPVRETLCEYAAYAVIHYFHLFRALRSKEREAEPMSMRIKEHRYNAVANRSNDNDIFGTNEGDTNQKDEVAVETLKELLGDPGVCPSCKKGGHTPTECHQTQQQQQASSGGPPAQFGAPVPHGHSGNASYHSAHYNAPPHPQNRSSGIPNEYGRNDRAATGADGYNNHNPYNARGGMPPVREGGNQYPPSYGRGGYRSSYPPRNDTGTFNGPPGMYNSSGAYHPTNRSDDVYGGPAQRRGGGPMDYNNRSPYHPNAGNAGSNPVRHNVVCEACNKPGHTAETCFQLKPDLMQSHPVVCSHCGMPGHREPRCFDKYPHLRQERSSGNPMEMGRGGGPSSRGPNIYQCTHCGRMGHTVDRCHQLYPELRKRLQRGDGEDAFGGSGSGSGGSNRDNNSQQQHMAPSFASSDGDESMSTKRRYY